MSQWSRHLFALGVSVLFSIAFAVAVQAHIHPPEPFDSPMTNAILQPAVAHWMHNLLHRTLRFSP